MQPARVSVVIPTYNSGHLLPEAVASVLAQTLPPAQIIVVDDGSTDATTNRLEPFRGQIDYVFQANQGVAAARNQGLKRARGDLVAFLDADDVWHPRKLEAQLEVLAHNPDLGLLGTGTFTWPAPLPDAGVPSAAVLVRVPFHRLVVRNYFTASSVVVRRHLLDRVGAFDPALRGPEDYDLWLRLAEVTAIANLDLPLTGYRPVAGSLSRQAVAMEAGMRRILHKLDGRRAWQGSRWLRRKAYGYCDYSCAYMYGAGGNQGTALVRLLRSFAGYPLPYRRGEVRVSLARFRLLARTVGNLLGVGRGARTAADH